MAVEEAVPTVSFVLIVGPVVVLTGWKIISLLGVPRFVRDIGRRPQAERLGALLAELPAEQDDLVVHWDRYRLLSKFEIMAQAESRGLLYIDEAITADGWALTFARAESAGNSRMNS